MTAQSVLDRPKPARGTTRSPGADLGRLPVGLDFRALSVFEGIRAALAIMVIVLIGDWIAWPPMSIAAVAALLTCLCDPGGPIGQRLPSLLSFVVMGALTWALFGLLQPAGIAIVLPLAGLGILLNSAARVCGQAYGQVGSILTVVLILALDEPLTPASAAFTAFMFAAGGLWAVLLVLVVWRLHPYRPARHAVAEAWRLLAAMAADLRDLIERDGVSIPEWEAHARAHRRAVRDAIEQARSMVLDTLRQRGANSPRAAQSLIRLEAVDQMFGTMIALSDLLEQSANPARLAMGRKLLRVLRPMLLVAYNSIETDHIAKPERLERGIARILADTAPDPALHGLAESMSDRLRIAIKLATPEGYLPDNTTAGEPVLTLGQRICTPLLANLNWNSAVLRHALRAALVGTLALGITMQWPGPFRHWLPITAVLTMQPFFAATWQRALERVAGTLLGAVIGSFLAFFTHEPITLALLMLPLAVLAFAVRQVSYGAFIACLTPLVIVFVEAVEPGHSHWEIAAHRAFFTISGGLLAVAASLLLWPSWEPDRLKRELFAAIAAHAAYARITLSALLGEPAGNMERARRAAGMASNNLEASLSRALHEPRRRGGGRLEAALVIDATLRRIAGRLSAMQHDPTEASTMDHTGWARWRDWTARALQALADQNPMPAAPPEPPASEAVGRVARQIELLDGALRRFETG
ncbi:MAG TPA: FUSC family protein [Acetobacteraceae bacterium]